MFKTLLKNKKAQNTAEYALLIALVVAGVIAMQTYAQRALQARVRDASQMMATKTNAIGLTNQYEPYYQRSQYEVTRTSTEETVLDDETSAKNMNEVRTRATAGFQESSVNGLINGI